MTVGTLSNQTFDTIEKKEQNTESSSNRFNELVLIIMKNVDQNFLKYKKSAQKQVPHDIMTDRSKAVLIIFSFCSRLCIRKTSPCNEYPLKPQFYIEKLGFAGVYLIFLFLIQNIHCGYSLEPPRRGGSNVYPQCMF